MIKNILFFASVILLFASCKKEPVAHYKIEILNCESPYEVQFNNRSQNFESYYWEINGDIYSNDDPVLRIPKGSKVLMKLVAQNGKKENMTFEIFQPEWYHILPTPDFSWKFPDCKSFESVRFTECASGPVDSYLWDFGDGNNSSEKNPFHTYTKEGSYRVQFSAITCSDTFTIVKEVSVRPENVLPKSRFSIEDSPGVETEGDVLFGNYIQFVNHSEYSTAFNWDFGNGQYSTETSPKYTYSATGTYTVTLTSGCDGNYDVFSKEIEVRKPSKMTIKSAELIDFPEMDDSRDWDEGEDEDSSETELPPDVYIRVMKGICEIFESNTLDNLSSNANAEWSINKALTNLSSDFKIEVWDKDDGDDQLMGVIEFQPDDYLDSGNYPSTIVLENSETEISFDVSWK